MQFLCLILAVCFSCSFTGKAEIELKSFNLAKQTILNNNITQDSKIDGKDVIFDLDQKNSLIKITDNSTCTFENITLFNFNFDYIKLENDSQIFFGKNVKIFLDNKSQNLDYKITFLENAQIYGNENTINIKKNGQIKIEKELTFYNLKASVFHPETFDLLNESSTLKLNESIIKIKNDVNFAQGKIISENDSKISGSFKFNYQSSQPIEILENSKLKFSQNLNLCYKPETITLNNDSSILEVKDSQLEIWHKNFSLNKGCFSICGQAKMVLNQELLEKVISSLNNLFSPELKTVYLSRISRIKFDKLETE